METVAFIDAAAQLIFFAFLIWALLSHVKEQRRQSAILAKIAELLEQPKRVP